MREIEGVLVDRGWLVGEEQNNLVLGFRTRFEEIMGNTPAGVDIGGIMQNLHERWESRGSAGAAVVSQTHDRERGGGGHTVDGERRGHHPHAG